MLARAEAMDNAYLRTGGGPLALNGGQLWLRQSDRQTSPQGVAIIHAQQVELHGKQLTAQQVSVFRLDGSDKLLSRIEATSATLARGNWVLENARTIRPDQLPQPPRTHEPADRPDGEPGAGEFRLARHAVVLGFAGFHRTCSTDRDFRRSATGCTSRRCWRCRCWRRP